MTTKPMTAVASGQKAEEGGFSPAEARIAAVWNAVLGAEVTGAEDEFFRLGGTLPHAAEMAARIAEEFGSEFGVETLPEPLTVRAVASFLAEEALLRAHAAVRVGRRRSGGRDGGHGRPGGGRGSGRRSGHPPRAPARTSAAAVVRAAPTVVPGPVGAWPGRVPDPHGTAYPRPAGRPGVARVAVGAGASARGAAHPLHAATRTATPARSSTHPGRCRSPFTTCGPSPDRMRARRRPPRSWTPRASARWTSAPDRWCVRC